MTMNRKELGELASAATPGPWKQGCADDLEIIAPNGWIVCRVRTDPHGDASDHDTVTATAALIAAANPTAIKALINEVEALEQENAHHRQRRDSFERERAELKTQVADLLEMAQRMNADLQVQS